MLDPNLAADFLPIEEKQDKTEKTIGIYTGKKKKKKYAYLLYLINFKQLINNFIKRVNSKHKIIAKTLSNN